MLQKEESHRDRRRAASQNRRVADQWIAALAILSSAGRPACLRPSSLALALSLPLSVSLPILEAAASAIAIVQLLLVVRSANNMDGERRRR